jgi:hypothetical protein
MVKSLLLNASLLASPNRESAQKHMSRGLDNIPALREWPHLTGMPDSRSCRTIVHCICSALFLVALSIRASGETVAVTDLAGMVVDADIHRQQDMRREGRSFSVQAHQRWKVDINADKTIDVTVNTTFRDSRGTRKAPPIAGRFTLDEALDVRSHGGGQGAWNFADGVLHFTRTFPSGAYRAHFAFARGEGGITCKVTEAFAREDGNKPITMESPFGGRVSIVNARQESSDCRVKSAKPE